MRDLINAITSYNTINALALIATGNSNTRYIDEHGRTPLILACMYKMSEVALALIATGDYNPGYVTRFEMASFIYACHNRMQEVALALITIGNNIDDSALTLAKRYNLEEVVYALEHYDEFMAKHTNPHDDVSSEPRIYTIEI